MALEYLLPEFLLALVYVRVQLVPVLPDGELLVVVYGDVDLLGAIGLVLRVVELSYVGVLQGLVGCQALVRVKLQHVAQEVQGVVGGGGEHVSQALGLGRGQRFQHGVGEGTLDGFDVVGSGPADELHHSVQLVQGAGAWEHWLAQEQLSQDAAHAPHVHSLGVLVRTQQNLRSTVPASGHIVSQQRDSVWVLNVKGTRKAEIRHFHVTL